MGMFYYYRKSLYKSGILTVYDLYCVHCEKIVRKKIFWGENALEDYNPNNPNNPSSAYFSVYL